MTMADNTCDVCGKRPPIGVASTHIPLSVAYCVECARAHADPETVFLWWEDGGMSPDRMRDGLPDVLCTWKDGRYISYQQWWDERKAIRA